MVFAVENDMDLHLCVATHCDVSYDCVAGETCAALDGRSFSCMPAGSSPASAPCDAALDGEPTTCADGLLCVATGDAGAGVCRAWCDGKPCPAGQSCQSVTTIHDVTLQYCQ
jgi:hypothetical protein